MQSPINHPKSHAVTATAPKPTPTPITRRLSMRWQRRDPFRQLFDIFDQFFCHHKSDIETMICIPSGMPIDHIRDDKGNPHSPITP
jgi:hypothetical protein